jgi:hypothetical protein
MQADGKRQLATGPNTRHGDHPCYRLIPPILPAEVMAELGDRLFLSGMHLRRERLRLGEKLLVGARRSGHRQR